MARIYIFKRFERFWHWSQAALIIFMLLTGFEVHGSYQFFGFENAVTYHTFAAWMIIALWVFAVFWHRCNELLLPARGHNVYIGCA